MTDQHNPDNSNNTEEDYSFIDEHIKSDANTWKKYVNKGLVLALYGLIIGFFACLMFYILSPWAQEEFAAKDKNQVQLSTDSSTDRDEGTNEEPSAESDGEGFTFTEENMEQMNSMVISLSKKCQKSMVEMVAIGADANVLSSSAIVSGVVVAETPSDLYVLVPGSILGGDYRYRARFVGGEFYDAEFVMDDSTSGLAVFQIKRKSLTDSDKSYYKTATLGNSYAASQGSFVLAMGRLYGSSFSLGQGIIATPTGDSSLSTDNYRKLVTDIPAGSEISGALFNFYGEVIGVITPTSSAEGANFISALAISDLKTAIEKMSNGREVPSLGITGTYINKSLAEDMGLVEGMFVSNVTIESPAMLGGLQNGDIISSVDGQTVLAQHSLQNIIVQHDVGNTIDIEVYRAGKSGYKLTKLTVTLMADRK